MSQIASLAVSVTLVPMLAALGGGARDATPEASGTGRWNSVARWGLFGVLAIPRLLTRGVTVLGRLMRPVVDRLLVPFDAGYAWLASAYPAMLRRTLARPWPVLAISTLGFAATLAVGAMLPRNLFPAVSQGEFFFNVVLPEGTALHVTDQAIERVAASLRKDPRVKHVYTSAGQIDLSAFAGSAREANRGQIAVALNRNDARTEEAVAGVLRDHLDQVPGLAYEFGRPSLFTFRNPVEVEVYAYNLDTLRLLSDAVAVRLAEVRGIDDIESSMRLGDPEVRIAFDRDRMAALSLDPAAASRLVRNAVQGEAATQFSDLDRKLDIRVRANEDERSAVAALASLEVGRNRGMAVPLGSVANVTVERGPSEIRRISQQRAAVVSGNLKERDLGSASVEIEAALATMELPPGTKVGLAGQNSELAQSFGSLRFALLLAVFLVYLVMASQFESLLHPFVIMFTLPMALTGVVLTLVLTGQSVSVMVLIGVVVQAGIVVNNGIVLIDYVKQRRAAGDSKIEALVQAGQVRLRPILMTTLVTALGLLPMAIGIGEGAEVRAPLALTLMGGLISSTVLTLIVLPAVYVTMDRRP